MKVCAWILSVWVICACEAEVREAPPAPRVVDGVSAPPLELERVDRWCGGLEKGVAEAMTCEAMRSGVDAYVEREGVELERLTLGLSQIEPAREPEVGQALSRCVQVVVKVRRLCREDEALTPLLKKLSPELPRL